jgi:hypothetical protein
MNDLDQRIHDFLGQEADQRYLDDLSQRIQDFLSQESNRLWLKTSVSHDDRVAPLFQEPETVLSQHVIAKILQLRSYEKDEDAKRSKQKVVG